MDSYISVLLEIVSIWNLCETFEPLGILGCITSWS